MSSLPIEQTPDRRSDEPREEIAIEVSGFRKTYGNVTAVDDISFTVRKGEIFGLLGPNGAGKTTTLECLEGLRRPDSGRLEILGVDPAHEPRRLNGLIGVQLQTSSLPHTMTCDDAMRFFCAYHGVVPRWDLLDRMGLREKRDTRYDELSTGLQRRLALALAIAHEPAVLILDEPTAGLDVASRVELHRLIAQLSDAGTTILLATHDMAEAERMTDRVAILLHGTIVAVGTPRQLTASGEGLTKISVRSEQGTLGDGSDLDAVTHAGETEEYTIVFTNRVAPTIATILDRLERAQDPLVDLRVERPSLEERFLELTTEDQLR
jgi:ABC-2 type transport system ATP-binding protein